MAEEEARLQAAEEEAQRAADEAARLAAERQLQSVSGQDSIEDLIRKNQLEADRKNDDLPFRGLDIETIIRNSSGSETPRSAEQ